MRKLIFILFVLPLFWACEKEEGKIITISPLEVYVEGSEYNEADKNIGIQNADIYIFKGLNFLEQPIKYIGNGEYKNTQTGEIVKYWKHKKSNKYGTDFGILPNDTYVIIADIKHLIGDKGILSSNGVTFKIPSFDQRYKVHIGFKLWPYSVFDLDGQ